MTHQFKHKKHSGIIALLLLAFSSISITNAQSIDELQTRFPNEHAVMQTYSRDMHIYVKDGKPYTESKVTAEIIILNDRANGIYNKYKVYHGSFNQMKDLEAYTKVADGKGFKKMKVTNLKTESSRSQGIFYDDMKETAFDFPSLTKGSIAYVNYTEINNDPHLLSPFYFMSYLPVVNGKFTVTYPADMHVKYTLRNDPAKKISLTENNRGREHSYTFTAQNVESPDRFGDAPAMSYYMPHVIVQIADYKNEKGEQTSYLNNVDDLHSWYYSFVKDLDNTRDPLLKSLSDSLTVGLTKPIDKAKAIYKWVQKNIKYVAFEDGMEGFVPRRAAAICTRRFGDCKDMSSILTALLQLAGVKAYFTWIGTRDLPYDYDDVPLPIVDNHMIAAVDIDGKWIFLDGTDPNCIFGLPSGFIQGKQALISLSDKDYKVVRVPEVESAKNEIIDSTFISLADNGIKGNSSVYYSGYFGSNMNNSLLYKDAADTKDFVKSRMGKASNKFILGQYAIHRISDEDKTVNIRADFEIPDYSKKIADELYINMNLEKFFNSNSVIDTAKRKMSKENDFKYTVKQYTILDVPTQYAVSYLPKNFEYKDDIMKFTIHYSNENNKIIARQEMTSNLLMMQPKDFDKWNTAVKQVLNQYKEQVVLQKH